MKKHPVLLGRLICTLTLFGLLSTGASAQIALREALDFDRDGKADYTQYRPSDYFWYTLPSGGGGGYLAQAWGVANMDRFTPGDYDGDNQADYAVFRDPTGVWYILSSSTFTWTAVHWGASGDEPVARDYDGDGRTDVAIVRRTPGLMVWWVYFFDGSHRATAWGTDTDFAVPGDYDGDGSFDVAVQRPGATSSSTAVFYVYGTTAGFFGVPWGVGDDYAVPGDYDGDGKTDIAVVRTGQNGTDPLNWYILGSNGNTFIWHTFGMTADDYFVQGDYDGDDRTDVAIWRQSTGFFEVKSSLTGQVSYTNWGIAGDLPIASYDTH